MIDFLKGIAIIAVVVDHLYLILYENQLIQNISFYSVTLFIYISGITSYLSMDAKNIHNYNYHYVLKRLKNVLIPYVIAILISQCITSHFFNFNFF